MGLRATCPKCNTTTGSVRAALRNGDPCPYCDVWLRPCPVEGCEYPASEKVRFPGAVNLTVCVDHAAAFARPG